MYRILSDLESRINHTFTVWNITPDGRLVGKEHLNDTDELGMWFERNRTSPNKDSNMLKVRRDDTGKTIIYEKLDGEYEKQVVFNS